MLFCFTSPRSNYNEDSIGSLVNVLEDTWYNVTVANDTRYFNEADYYVSQILSGVDFRAKNLESFESLENTSIDLYASIKLISSR